MAGGRRRTGTIFIIIALILIIALAAFYFIFFRNQAASPLPMPNEGGSQVQQNLVPVVITVQYIPRGAIITADVLQTVELPAEKVPQNLYFQDINDVIGMRAKYDLEAQIFLTRNLVTDSSPGSKTAFQIDPGKAAIAVPINATTGVNFAPQPGDHVMIIACMTFIDVDPTFQSRLPNYTATVMAPGATETGVTASTTITSGGALSSQGRFELDTAFNQPVYVLPSETGRPRLVCQTVVQDAAVLRLGKFPINTSDNPDQAQTQQTVAQPQEGAEPPPDPTSITLVVTPQDAVMMYYLMQSGANINLALRSAGDNQQIVTEPVTMQFVMDQRNIALPAKLPYAFDTRINELIYPAYPRTTSPVVTNPQQPQP